MRYIVRNERVHQNAIDAVTSITYEPIMQVDITRYVDSKTRAQENWFHKLCDEFGRYYGMDSGDVKEIAKAKLFGWRKIEFGGIDLVIADGSSTKLNKHQYSDLIEILYRMAADSGFVLPDPVDPFMP
jgi:hypothetical protein